MIEFFQFCRRNIWSLYKKPLRKVLPTPTPMHARLLARPIGASPIISKTKQTSYSTPWRECTDECYKQERCQTHLPATVSTCQAPDQPWPCPDQDSPRWPLPRKTCLTVAVKPPTHWQGRTVEFQCFLRQKLLMVNKNVLFTFYFFFSRHKQLLIFQHFGLQLIWVVLLLCLLY